MRSPQTSPEQERAFKAKMAQDCLFFFNEGRMDEVEFSKNLFRVTDAKRYIRSISVLDKGRLDIQATADRLGIPLEEHELGFRASIGGTGPYRKLSKLAISLHLQTRAQQRLVNFSHEVGHYFYDEVIGLQREVDDSVIEQACDYFGRRMVLQDFSAELVDEVDEILLLGAADTYGVDIDEVIWRLMEVGKLPDLVAVDGRYGEMDNPEVSFKCSRAIICQNGMFSGCSHVNSDDASQYGNIRVFNFTNYVSPIGSSNVAKGLSEECGLSLHNRAKVPSVDELTKHYDTLPSSPTRFFAMTLFDC